MMAPATGYGTLAPARSEARRRPRTHAAVLGLVLCGLALGAAGTRLHAQRRRDAQLSTAAAHDAPSSRHGARRDDDDRGVDDAASHGGRRSDDDDDGSPHRGHAEASLTPSFLPSAAPTMEQCASTCTNTSALFNVSITDATGRGMPYWRPASQPALGEYDEDVTAVIVIQHGDFEYAEDFVCYVWNMLRMEFVGEEHWGARIHIVAPQFWAYDEQYADNRVWNAFTHESTLWWEVAGAWMDGGATQEFEGRRMSSFSVYDEIIAKLGDMRIYPNMKTVILSGFSAGGQFIQRLAAAALARSLASLLAGQLS